MKKKYVVKLKVKDALEKKRTESEEVGRDV